MPTRPAAQQSPVTPWLWAALIGAAFYAAGALCAAMPRAEARVAPIWISNAIALAALLRARTHHWPVIVGACVGGNLAVGAALPFRLDVGLAYTTANAAEYLVGAIVLRRLLGADVRMDRGRDLALLAVVASASTLVSAPLAALLLAAARGDAAGPTLQTWALGHPLSLLLITPCLLVLSRWREHLAQTPPTRRALLALVLLTGCAAAVFSQSAAPILFLIPPALLFVALELGVLGAAIGVLITAAIAVAGTLQGRGPIVLAKGGLLQHDLVLQLFLVTALFASLPVAALRTRERTLRSAAQREAARAARAEAEAEASEARYRLLAEQASDIIATSNMKGEFEYLSPSVLRLSGYAPAELVGYTVADYVRVEDFARLQRTMGEMAAGVREPGTPIEYRLRRKDGRWVWMESNPQPVYDANGAPVGFVDIARDITARKAMEAELEEARRAAEAAAAAKSQFLANMSHELRTPLTAVLGFSGLVAEQPELSAASRRYLDRVRTAGKTLLSTVNDVLDVSRLEIGQVEIVPAPVAPGALARETLALFETDAAGKGLILRLDDATAGAWFALDEARIRQILVNLVANAVKFTERGEVAVSLAHRDGVLELQVRDTGVGIAADQLGLLFQRFSQVDSSNTRRHGGSGLGLAICKGLAEAMGGGVEVRSQLGAGSVFSVRVPAPVASQEGLDAAA